MKIDPLDWSGSEIRHIRMRDRNGACDVIGEIIARIIGADGFHPRPARASSVPTLEIDFALPGHGERGGIFDGECDLYILAAIVQPVAFYHMQLFGVRRPVAVDRYAVVQPDSIN